jgi:hypothetical protein
MAEILGLDGDRRLTFGQRQIAERCRRTISQRPHLRLAG